MCVCVCLCVCLVHINNARTIDTISCVWRTAIVNNNNNNNNYNYNRFLVVEGSRAFARAESRASCYTSRRTTRDSVCRTFRRIIISYIAFHVWPESITAHTRATDFIEKISTLKHQLVSLRGFFFVM